jgi:integrase
MELKSQIAKGINPVKEKAKQSGELTFKQLFDRYIEHYGKHSIKKWKEVISTVDKRAKHLYGLKISDIERNHLQKIFIDLTENVGKITANRFLERMSSIFNKAIEWGLVNKNPTAGIKKHKERSRDRYLIIEEIPRFFAALENEPNKKVVDFILISLYTGARKSNVLAMKWANISFENKTWYIPETKNDVPQLVPLVDEAIEVLQRRKEDNMTEWVFPSDTSASGHLQEPRKVWTRILKAAAIKDLRIHDLRRTLGSWMANFGASQYIIGKSLNHKSPQSTAVYARLSIDPVREFMNKVSTSLNQMKDKNYIK